MEQVLAYSRDQVHQDTGYNCGPASAQTIIRSKTGRLIGERELGRRMGTHTGGTDTIDQVAAVLNAELKGAGYRTVSIGGASASAGQIERLWQDVKRSVASGHGVVANIIAPPSNYPKAVLPSTISPAYSGGDVYHYVAIMGLAEDHRGRRYWIADSGFSPFGYWCSATQMAHLIAGKGYAYAADAAPLAPPAPPAAPQAPAPGKTGPAFTIDISEWQNGLQLSRAKADGIEGVILRVCDGTYQDKVFRSHLQDALANGLPVATYIYLRHPSEGTTVEQQVNAYQANCPEKHLPVWLDAESPAGITVALLEQFHAEFTRRGYRVAGVYTYRTYWRDRMGSPVLRHLGHVWNAAYGKDLTGTAAELYPGDRGHATTDGNGWADFRGQVPSMWQFGSKVRVAGHAVDGNAIRDRALLRSLFHNPNPQEDAPVAFDYARDTNAQLTGSTRADHYPGFPSLRWHTRGTDRNPSFTVTDYAREADRELNSRLDYTKHTPADEDTMLGHVMALRREVAHLASHCATCPSIPTNTQE